MSDMQAYLRVIAEQQASMAEGARRVVAEQSFLAGELRDLSARAPEIAKSAEAAVRSFEAAAKRVETSVIHILEATTDGFQKLHADGERSLRRHEDMLDLAIRT